MVDGLLIGGAGVMAAGAWAALLGPRRLRVARYEVASERWPATGLPLRVAVLGDLHAAWPNVTAARLRHIVARILAERPGLVLLPGDFLANRTAFVRPLPVETVARALAPLAAAAPTLAVLGNHDWHRRGGEAVRRALRAVGIEVLENEARTLRLSGTTLQIGGLGCAHSGRADLPRLLARLEVGPPTILVSHVPDVVAYLPDSIFLTVAGHTHGGQIRLPRIGPLITMSGLPRRMARGHHRLGQRQLIVTSGVGTSMLPVRLGVPPEYVVATVRAAVAASAAGARDRCEAATV